MCYEHLRFLLYKLGAAEAGDLRYGCLYKLNWAFAVTLNKLRCISTIKINIFLVVFHFFAVTLHN